jgi:hypothetical protein
MLHQNLGLHSFEDPKSVKPYDLPLPVKYPTEALKNKIISNKI